MSQIKTKFIEDLAITTAKLANDAVTKEKVAADVAGYGIKQEVSGALSVDADNSTIEVSGTGKVQLKDGGITTAKLNASIAGDGIDIVSGALVAAVDHSTVEINASGEIAVKNDGITDSKIAQNISLRGVPTAPTASSSTNTTQIATTAFVQTVTSAAVAAEAALRVSGDNAISTRIDGIDTSISTINTSLGTLGSRISTAESNITQLFDADTALDGRLDTAEATLISHGTRLTQAEADILTKIPLSQKGTANGVATLGSDGKVPSAQIPALSIVEPFVVTSESEMLALNAQTGDVAMRTDINKTFILSSNSPTVLADWKEVLTPAAPVQSVNGFTGHVSLTSDNVNEGSTNLYFTTTRARTAAVMDQIAAGVTTVAPSQAAVYTALGLKQDKITPRKQRFTLSAQDVTNGYVDLAHTAIANTIMVQPAGGPCQDEGTDYTVSLTGGVGGVTRITWVGNLAGIIAEQDELRVSYIS